MQSLQAPIHQGITEAQTALSTFMADFFFFKKSAIRLQDPFEERLTDTPMTGVAKGTAGSLTQLSGVSLVEQPTALPAYFML